MKIHLDQTKIDIMQSYLKYKAYYERNAKAAPLDITDCCYMLIPKADNQARKIPFREFRWCGPYKVEKVLPNNKSFVADLTLKRNYYIAFDCGSSLRKRT